MHRRSFLAGLAATVASLRARAPPSAEERLDLANKRLAEIEAREGGRLGVFVRDTGTGSTLEHRTDERFPMCSTFKLLAAAAALKRVDEGAERLDRRIAYGPSDLLNYAPIAKAHVAEGAMTLSDLCAAAIDWSDVGSWAAVYELLAKRAGANVSTGRVLALDAAGNLISSPSKFVAAVGISDLVIVETSDALLVCSRERAQDVGRVVKWLEQHRMQKLL